jgi:hypothetical protein
VPNKFIQRKEGFWINSVNCIRFTKFEHNGNEFPEYQSSNAIQLPPGQWSIVGLSDELTEEQKEELGLKSLKQERLLILKKD